MNQEEFGFESNFNLNWSDRKKYYQSGKGFNHKMIEFMKKLNPKDANALDLYDRMVKVKDYMIKYYIWDVHYGYYNLEMCSLFCTEIYEFILLCFQAIDELTTVK